MTIQLSLIHKYFKDIKSGNKTVEGRLDKIKFHKLAINDKIEYTQKINVKKFY